MQDLFQTFQTKHTIFCFFFKISIFAMNQQFKTPKHTQMFDNLSNLKRKSLITHITRALLIIQPVNEFLLFFPSYICNK